MYQKLIFLFILSLFLFSAGRQMQAQEYTNDSLWKASVGDKIKNNRNLPDTLLELTIALLKNIITGKAIR